MKKVFIVDDDPDILEAIQMILELENYEVNTTAQCQKVIDQIRQYRPDIILLDVLLSGYDGRDIAKQIRGAGNGISKTPILMMSAHANLGSSITETGANDFIAKPFDIEEMIAKIRVLTN